MTTRTKPYRGADGRFTPKPLTWWQRIAKALLERLAAR